MRKSVIFAYMYGISGVKGAEYGVKGKGMT